LINFLGKDGSPIRSWAVRSRAVWSWSVRSWGRPVNGCWGIRSWGCNNNWGWGIRSWSWGISWGSSIDGLSRVFDISNIAIAISSVGDSLETTIGKVDMVFSVGVVTFTGLTGSKVGSTVSISNTIIVVVGWDSVRVGGLSTISWGWSIDWGWCINRGRCVYRSRCILSRGSSHKSKQSNKGLKRKRKMFKKLKL
jgi:hypothetical protein